MTPSLISQAERGLANPSARSLLVIADALGVRIGSLFDDGRGQVTGDASPDSGQQSGGAEAGSDSIWAAIDASAPAPIDEAVGGVVPVVRHANRPVLNTEGGIQWQRLTAAADPDIEFFQFRYEVGSSSGELAHQHQGREHLVLLQGRMQVEFGFNKYTLGPGDSISIDNTIPHRLVNAGDVPVIGHCVLCGR